MLRLKKYAKSPYWQVRGTVAGKLIHQSTGTVDKPTAEKFRRKLEKETYDYFALGEELPATFADAVTVYAKKGGEKRYLTRLLDYFKEKPLKEIGQTEINDAVEALYPNARASTINRSLISPYITVVRAAIKAELPAAVLRPIERRRETKPIVTPADDEHIAKLLLHCNEGLAALITLMTYTGLRTGEALRVKQEDCKDGWVTVERTKNGDGRRIPAPVGWIFPLHGFGFSTTQGVGRALRKAHGLAGIPYRDGHELGRHTFAARWLASGASIKGLKEAGGWRKLAVVDSIYGHMEMTKVHETMRELSRKK